MDRSEIRRDKGSPPATPKRRKGVCVGEKDRAALNCTIAEEGII